MTDDSWPSAAPEAFSRLSPRLEVLLGGIQGGYGVLDWVARDEDGGLVVLLAADGGRFLDLLGRALAERLWLEPRVADWARLAPERRLDPARGLHLWVAGTAPEPGAEEAARETGIGLLRMLRVNGDWHADPVVAAGQGPGTATPSLRPRSVFRSGRPVG